MSFGLISVPDFFEFWALLRSRAFWVLVFLNFGFFCKWAFFGFSLVLSFIGLWAFLGFGFFRSWFLDCFKFWHLSVSELSGLWTFLGLGL